MKIDIPSAGALYLDAGHSEIPMSRVLSGPNGFADTSSALLTTTKADHQLSPRRVEALEGARHKDILFVGGEWTPG